MQYFVDENGVYRKVPKGFTAADMGFDEEKATELPRFPKDFEEWQGDKFTVNLNAKAEDEENARLRRMSPRERQIEAIEKAAERMINNVG